MNKVKKIICKNWIDKKCKFMSNSNLCSFAHGENDIIKEKCFNGINCFNEFCKYEHFEDWDPYINKVECDFCIKGLCNKTNLKYKHINNNIKENNKDIIFDKYEDFPEIIKNKNINDINNKLYEYKYSDILKSNLINYKEKWINDENLKDIEKNIKKELNVNNDNNKIIDIKNQLNNKYHEIKNTNKKENIYNENLNLDIIFDEKSTFEEEYIPIKININNIEIDNHENKEVKDNIKILIKNMEKDFKIYNEEIKKSIKDIIKDDNIEFILINNMNKILSKINLFKNNYEDIINML